MTRYEELNNAAQQLVDNFADNRRQALSFFDQLHKGLISYLGIDAPMRVLPPEPRDPSTRYTPPTALTAQDDDSWVIFLVLPLLVQKGQISQLDVYIQFSIRVESNKVLVRVDESKRAHTVPNGNGAELEPVYQEVFETAKALVKKTFEAVKTSQIGFTPG